MQNLLQLLISVVEGVNELLPQNNDNNTSVNLKSPNQLVTDTDIAVEKYLIAALQCLLPDAGFITEEQQITQNADKEYVWVIDPIDGTTNFVHQIPVFCVSVALLHNNKPYLGVVYELNAKEMFSAEKGKGAFLNGIPMHVSNRAELKDTLIATGFPYYDYGRIDPYLNSLKAFMKETRGVRRLGSAAADLAYVACGRFDAFYEYSLSPWDVAAGILLVEEAGGTVDGFNAVTDPLFGREIIAANPLIFVQVQSILHNSGL
jgi:myo-inositol-1(or 4)-monophosphatase